MRVFVLLFFVLSCDNIADLPKQKSFFAPDFQMTHYQESNIGCKYNFLINSKASISNIKNCNYNIVYKNLNSKIYINHVNYFENIEVLLNAFDQKIIENSKFSDQIIESEYIDVDRKIYSKLFSFVGDSPSNIQFYVTDMSDKFINGSLLFDSKPNYDSLLPYINYIRNDLKKMVDSFNWTDE
jgi:gliding motility-associated lipoprotein GldD